MYIESQRLINTKCQRIPKIRAILISSDWENLSLVNGNMISIALIKWHILSS